MLFFFGGGMGGEHFRRGGGKKVWGGDLKIFCVQNKPKKPQKISADKEGFYAGNLFYCRVWSLFGNKIFLGGGNNF